MANTSNTVELKKLFGQIKNKILVKPDNTKDSYSGFTENEFIELLSKKEKRTKFYTNYNVSLKKQGINLGTLSDFETKYGTVTTVPTETQNTNVIDKLIKIDNTLRKTATPNLVTWTSNDKKRIWIFWADGDWRERKNDKNNRVGQIEGKWSFEGNVYKIVASNGDVFIYKKGWKRVSGDPNKKGNTWRNVTFTLADVAAGKAVLKIGDRGPAVEELQKLMIKMNFSKVSKSGQPDGKYGKLTRLSILQFQGEMPYGQQDGKVGRITLNRMYRVHNYDPDLEVDDVQTNSGTPQGTTTQTPTPQATTVPQSVPTPQAATVPQAAPVGVDTPQAPKLTKPRLGITPDVDNLNESIKKIVSRNLKSLIK